MAIENNFLSNFIWNLLGDSWDFFENRNDINAKWDGDMHKIANLYLQGINTDASKGLFTVLVEPKTERHLFIFDDTTAVDATLLEVELQAEFTLGSTTSGDGSGPPHQ